MTNNCNNCPQEDNCPFDKGTQVGQCLVVENATRIKELELAKPYLNSTYYWERLGILQRKKNDKPDTYSHNSITYE
jgi:hypothetical protein